MSDAVAVMHQGKIVEKASCAQIFSQPAQSYTQNLLAAII
jgi:ABC-type dipeptide/oligopeptide/nickel transport system ATPase component